MKVDMHPASVCQKCGREIVLQDEAWSFSAHIDTGALWWHARCYYPKHGGWPTPDPTKRVK